MYPLKSNSNLQSNAHAKPGDGQASHEKMLIVAAHSLPGPLWMHFVSSLFTLNILLGSALLKTAVMYLVHRKGIKWELIKLELLN